MHKGSTDHARRGWCGSGAHETAKGGHQTLDAITPKDSEQIVLQRQEVTGAARVSLPAAKQTVEVFHRPTYKHDSRVSSRGRETKVLLGLHPTQSSTLDKVRNTPKQCFWRGDACYMGALANK